MVALEHNWNLNILCVDTSPDVLKFYQDVLLSADRITSATQRYTQNNVNTPQSQPKYKVFPAMSGKAAVRTALEAKHQGNEIAVGFFDMGIAGEIDGIKSISEIKRIFPTLLCAVVTDRTDTSVTEIQKIFESQDEWLYIKKPFTREELLQTTCNLVVSWNLRGEQSIAMQKITTSQEKVQRLLVVTPKLFQLQSYQELCQSVVDEATQIMTNQHAFLAMKHDNKMEFVAGRGKFEPVDDDVKVRSMKILENPASWDEGCLIPISVGETPLGLLFVDELPPENRDTEIIEIFTSLAASAFENLKAQAKKEAEKMQEQELKIGKNIQQSLLPKSIPPSPDIDLYGLMSSAKEIGGDYYDFYLREAASTATVTKDIYVSIGDVSGKGVPAGLIMSEARSFIRALSQFYRSPRKILDQVALLLEKDIWGTGKFMSLLLMLWDSKTRKFTFSSAGHEHIIHYQATKKKCLVFKAGGVVLGLKYKIVSPHLKETELEIMPGDVIVLFTDGVTEAMDVDNNMFSLEKLVQLTEEYAHLPVDQLLNNIFQSICDFIGSAEQHDDITMVGIKKK